MRLDVAIPLVLLLALAGCKTGGGAKVKDDDEAAPPEAGDSEEAAPLAREPTPAILARANAKLCPGELGSKKGFFCLPRKEALDHFHEGGKQITVTFVVHPALKQPAKGMLINIDGGPGYSGIESADNYFSTDPKITEQFDVVWFDLRGVGLSGGMQCKAAAEAFYAGGLRIASPAEEAAILKKAKAFAAACPAEIAAGSKGAIAKADIPFYNTRQAAEDLDDIRSVLGFDKMKIYGLSYGTQLAQTYVRNHPEHVEAVIIDGVVDLGLDHLGFQTSLLQGNLKILDLTFETCTKSPACARSFGADVGGNPGAAFAKAAQFLAGDKVLSLKASPKAGAFKVARLFGRRDLDATTYNALGHAETRRDFLRALPAAARGDFGPMLDVYYAAAGIDAKTAGAIGTQGADPDMSDAVYYAITCNDYGTTDAPAYLAKGRELAAADDRLLSPYFGDLPCAFWPGVIDQPTPGPLTATGIPFMVVSATGDAQTPFSMGETVFANLDQGHRVLFTGGHHVMYGAGNQCGDAPVTQFLLGKAVAKAIPCDDVVLAPGSFLPKKRGQKHRTY